jgi:hypothetical protein
MEKKKISFVSVFVVVAMLVAIFVPMGTVVAPVGKQHNRWGTVVDGPDPVSTGNTVGGEITAWIDGVIYGSNVTTALAEVDLYIDGDTWAVAGDDAVKQGGYDGDDTMYFLDYTPANYLFNISTTTTSFLGGEYQNHTINPMYFDTETEFDIGVPGGDTYLRGLKINEIVINPSSGNQYVYLYDPGGQLSEAALEDATHGYYLEKDDPWPTSPPDPHGPIFDFDFEKNYVWQVPATNYYYIELAGFTLDPADELKLVWKNPPNWGGSITNNEIANNTDVIVDRVEWGNHVNWINESTPPDDRDYDNTTMLDFMNLPLPGGASMIRSDNIDPNSYSGNGTDTDDCSADFKLLNTATPPYSPGGVPGFPTELTVHKGPYSGKGVAGDLVLYWKAPSVNWLNLVLNIVYYDSDLTDGFQYTNYIYFTPNSTAVGMDDWCVLPGWFADPNNYAFIVRTTGDLSSQEGGLLENPVGTNIGYKYGIELIANAPPQTSQKFVSIPYICDWKKASDIAGPGTEFLDGSIIDAVLRWNYTKQDYDFWTFGIFGWGTVDYDIIPGDAIAVAIITTTPYTWKIVGSYDDTVTFEFVINTPPQTSQMYTSLPYHKAYTYASDVAGPGKEFTDGLIIDAVLQWNYTKQDYDYWTFGIFGWGTVDYAITPSPGDHLAFAITTSVSYFWQPQVISL